MPLPMPTPTMTMVHHVDSYPFPDDDSFSYVIARTDPWAYYALTPSPSRLRAIYTTADGVAHFDTVSARGVATMDAASCAVVDFCAREDFIRDARVVARLRAMRTFAQHRVWKAFQCMRLYARRRRMRRRARALEEASRATTFGDGRARCGASIARASSIARAFAREVVDDGGGVDAGGDDEYLGASAATTTTTRRWVTYDLDAWMRFLDAQTQSALDEMRACAEDIARAITATRDGVDAAAVCEFEARVRPMIAATASRYACSAIASTSRGSNDADAIADQSHAPARAPQELYAHTARALARARDAQVRRFARSMWLAFQCACAGARRSVVALLRAHIDIDATNTTTFSESDGDTSSLPLPSPLFTTAFVHMDDDDMTTTTTLDPDWDAFARAIRAAAYRWNFDAMRDAIRPRINTHDDHGDDTSYFAWSDGLGEEEREFHADIEATLARLADGFETARADVARETLRLRAIADSINDEDMETKIMTNDSDTHDADAKDADADAVDRYVSKLTRASDFMRELEGVPNVYAHSHVVAIDVSARNRALKAKARRARDESSDDVARWLASATQACADALTRIKLENEGGTKDASEIESRVRDARMRVQDVGAALVTAKTLRVPVPDFTLGAFEALEREIDMLSALQDEHEDK